MTLNFWPVCGCIKKEEDEDQAHLHKPRDNKLYQQKLKPCCMLVITTQKVVTLFIVTGLIFLPIGITLLVQSTEIYQHDMVYTECLNEFSRRCSVMLDENNNQCKFQDVPFKITKEINGPLMMLYGLKNYYQNHRLYRQSQSFEQLLGNVKATCLQDYCNPYSDFTYFDDLTEDNQTIPFYPRGAIANSYFTDTFTIIDGDNNEIELDFKDISWKSDRDSKFLIPDNFQYEENPTEFSWPKDWKKWIGDATVALPKNIANEHLINWMNVAAFPSFTKLYAKVNLKPGSYKLKIDYRYKVHSFGGEKFVRLAETSWMGGRSLFLGSAYVIVGVLCLVSAGFFVVISSKTRNKRHERKMKINEQLHEYKNDNNLNQNQSSV